MSNDNGASATMHEAAQIMRGASGVIEHEARNLSGHAETFREAVTRFEQSVDKLDRLTRVQLKVEGMKAFNSWRTSNGMQPGYEQHHFTDLESEL